MDSWLDPFRICILVVAYLLLLISKPMEMSLRLQVINEKVFKKISDVLAQAVCSEEKC